MIKIKLIKKEKFYTVLKRGETGVYKIEDIYLQIGRNKHFFCEKEHYKEWNRLSPFKISNKIRTTENKEELKNKLQNLLNEYTEKEIKNIDRILEAIIYEENYNRRGSKNYEGIKIIPNK